MSDGTLEVAGYNFWSFPTSHIIKVYICQVCSALTPDMTTHANWHDDTEER